MATWNKAVREALAEQRRTTGSDLVTRSDLVRNHLPTIVQKTDSTGATPEQTLSRVLQELRNEKDPVLEFTGDGEYRILRDPIPRLVRYQDYSRVEVHDIFAPDTSFTPQTGTWGLHGIVPIPNRTGDFVFFVTFGQSQGDHSFEEFVTEGGVLSWQSQPRQNLATAQIRQFIEHNELTNSIYLFLRTKRDLKYTYLGQLKYLDHDPNRESPVYFHWQILDWDPEGSVAGRIGLTLEPDADATADANKAVGLTEAPVPTGISSPFTTATFQSRKGVDYAGTDQRNKKLGTAGELAVVDHERGFLASQGRPDLAANVRHIAVEEGDGAGFDVESWTLDGRRKLIEVKTTKYGAATPFELTSNEVARSRQDKDIYYLYRLYGFAESQSAGNYWMVQGDLSQVLDLAPSSFRARPLAGSQH